MPHGAPLALDVEPQLASEALWPRVFTVVPLALYLGAPPALEVPKALDLERLPAPCSTGSRSGAPGSFKGLMVPKESMGSWGLPRALVTDETIWDHGTYICMTDRRLQDHFVL